MELKKQQGFTLIELIMVIVILGILAATALPKFADLSGNARKSSVQGAQGAVKSASSIVHAQALAEGKATNATDTVTLEGASIAIVYGYPAATSIATAAGIAAPDYNVAVAASVSTISATKDAGATAVANCNFTYTQTASATVAPVIGNVVATGC